MQKLRQMVNKKIKLLEFSSNLADEYFYWNENDLDLTTIQIKLLIWTSTMLEKSKSITRVICEINKRIEFLEFERKQIQSQDEKIVVERNIEVLEYCKYLINRYDTS